MPRKASGFTLIELMITLVIIAILAGVAYPSYVDYIRKARRSDAQAGLEQRAQLMERCFTQYGVYNNANCPTAANDSPEGYYSITGVATAGDTTATVFLLTATPTTKGNQNQDTDCAQFTISQTGAKAAENSGGSDNTTACWKK